MRVYLCFILFSIFTSIVYAYSDQITQGNCSPAVKDVQGNVTFNFAEKRSLSASNVEIIDSTLDRHDSPYTQSQKEGEIKKITPKSKILQIEQACMRGQEKEYDYDFPTIDFKFQNTGDAAAFLWQFAVHVIEAEIDSTPVLKFNADAVDGALQITVSNKGWGNLTCQFQLEEPILNRLFTPIVRQKQAILGSVDEFKIFRLTLDKANTAELAVFSRELMDTSKPIRGLSLNPKVNWNCKDEKNVEYQGQLIPIIPSYHYKVVITANGFVHRISRAEQPDLKLSDTIYVAIIADPQQKEPQKLIYPISREIPPGDVERFHIMVGSLMSAKLRLQFEFFIDKNKTVKSEVFEIHIWNPRDSKYTVVYEDGDELRRDLDRQKKNLVEARKEIEQCQDGSQKESWRCSEGGVEELEQELEHLKHRIAGYPFLDSTLKNSN